MLSRSIHSRIVFRCTDKCFAQVKYTWGAPPEEKEILHGSHHYTEAVIDFADDEYITGVEGFFSANYVTQLTFSTNKSLLRSPQHPQQITENQ